MQMYEKKWGYIRCLETCNTRFSSISSLSIRVPLCWTSSSTDLLALIFCFHCPDYRLGLCLPDKKAAYTHQDSVRRKIMIEDRSNSWSKKKQWIRGPKHILVQLNALPNDQGDPILVEQVKEKRIPAFLPAPWLSNYDQILFQFAVQSFPFATFQTII